jgi:hypothetical protein
MKKLENASLKTFLQRLLQKNPTNASLQNVILKEDLFKHLLSVKHKINAPKRSVTQAEDVFTNQLFVMSFQEELPTYVTKIAEFVNVNNHLAMITMHVPLMHMLREEDALTHQNANLTTFVFLLNVINLLDLAHSLRRTVTTEILVPSILATL